MLHPPESSRISPALPRASRRGASAVRWREKRRGSPSSASTVPMTVSPCSTAVSTPSEPVTGTIAPPFSTKVKSFHVAKPTERAHPEIERGKSGGRNLPRGRQHPVPRNNRPGRGRSAERGQPPVRILHRHRLGQPAIPRPRLPSVSRGRRSRTFPLLRPAQTLYGRAGRS